MVFMDFSWVAERTTTWDAIGLVAYALLIALLETLGVFIVVALLGLLLPANWASEKRTALVGVLFLILSLWAMIGQLYFVSGYSLPPEILKRLGQSGHPVRILLSILTPLVALSLAMPVWSILRSDKAVRMSRQIFERLTVPSLFYLFFDLLGILIVFIRSMLA